MCTFNEHNEKNLGDHRPASAARVGLAGPGPLRSRRAEREAHFRRIVDLLAIDELRDRVWAHTAGALAERRRARRLLQMVVRALASRQAIRLAPEYSYSLLTNQLIIVGNK